MKQRKIRNFLNFLFLCWQTVSLPPPTDLQYDIAKYLANSIKAKIIQAFRGCGKTWITAAYVCWRLHINKNEKILIVSASKEKAIEISNFIKRLIAEMPLLQELKPNSRDNDRDAITAFDVAGCEISVAPSVKVCGIFGQLTGSRATIIIADDIETSENARTQEMRDKIDNAVTEFDNIIVPESNEIIYLGTPHSQESLYTKLISRGYACRIWTCKYVDEADNTKYNKNLAPFVIANNEHKAGEPTEPVRFTLEILLDKELKMGRSKFQMQFMLDATLSDLEKYPLKCSDLIVMSLDADSAPEKVIYASDKNKIINDLICMGFSTDRFFSPMYVSEKWLPYQDKVMSIDPSGKGKDELAFSVLGLLNSQIYWLDNGGMQGGYVIENLELLAKVAKKWKVNRIFIEKNYGGGMFTALFMPVLKRIYPECVIEEITVSKQKETRIIDTIEPILNQHKLIVNRQVILDDFKYSEKYPSEKKSIYTVFYQLTHITRDSGCLAHDDRLDALEMGISQLVESMSLDVDEQIKIREDEELLEILEEYETYHQLKTKPINPDEGTWMYL